MLLTTVIRQTPFKSNFASHVFIERKHNTHNVKTFASKKDPKTQHQFNLSFKLPNPILAQSAVAIFAMGFIDAGYSGDWSRIGVISKESEELVKVAAFLVVPLSTFVIFSISKKDSD